MDRTDIYRIFHSAIIECTFFSSVLGLFSGIDHMLAYKSLNIFKKTEIISDIFSDHSGRKLEIKTGGTLENSQIFRKWKIDSWKTSE